MSIPKRHHYVPRVHIRKFKKESGYYLFLKGKEELKNPQSSSDFFVKTELNTVGGVDGIKDHTSLENELTEKWDNNFNKHFKNILENLYNPNYILPETLLFFFEYSIIANLRRSKMDISLNETLIFKEVIPNFIEGLSFNGGLVDETSKDDLESGKILFRKFYDDILKLEDRQSGLKFSSLIPTEVKSLLPQKCHCIIYYADNDLFILPDCTSRVERSDKLFNLHGLGINGIARIGIPLTPKVYIEILNSDILGRHDNIVVKPTFREIGNINYNLFKIAKTQVLLNSPEQL
ncbi:DUF4238 domain-containing protein [bacterium]|nr:DUF4238 domain-containing protein [bacterium]